LIKDTLGATISPVKTVAQLLPALPGVHARGEPRRRISGIAYDSRQVQPGQLFVALKGLHTDGHLYAAEAVRRGAVALLHSDPLPRCPPEVTCLRVPDSRLAMSPLAAAFHDHPSRELTVVGVTGTDGKSTTVWLIHQLLQALGRPAGFLSTVQFSVDGEVVKNPLRQSTPEAPEIQGLLRRMVQAGRRYAVVEATSHGLSARTARLADVRFDAAVCTNVTHEHLEFHGSFEQYRSDKANLFRALSRPGSEKPDSLLPPGGRFGVVNRNDGQQAFMAAQCRAPVVGYALAGGEDAGAELRALLLEGDLGGSRFRCRYGGEEVEGRFRLPGAPFLEDLLAAILTVLRLLDLPLRELTPLFAGLSGVPGRMLPVRLGQPFQVIVDYAHTPGAFERLLPLVRRHTPGRLTAVFGSAGERDLEKRARQGEIAARYCDLLVLADEDPRGEDPLQILQQIAAGARAAGGAGEPLLVPDRREAIRLALGRARPGDTVLLLGKGHEQSIIYAGGAVPWDEAGAAAEALRELGYDG
jgi:UDP-N-acetylmuramoyl-L-alanyl-D-glutamate--2,6-diaminopimelate ligase